MSIKIKYKKITAWYLFREFINSSLLGENINRQELLLRIYKKCDKSISSRNTTVDSYRNMAEKSGYLSKFELDGKIISGHFIIQKHFQKEMTSTDLRKEYSKRV